MVRSEAALDNPQGTLERCSGRHHITQIERVCRQLSQRQGSRWMVGLQRLPGKRHRPLIGNTGVDQLSLEPELISELHDRIDRGCVR